MIGMAGYGAKNQFRTSEYDTILESLLLCVIAWHVCKQCWTTSHDSWR